MAKDLGSFLREYEEAYPEQVLHVEKEIGSNQQVTAFITKLEKESLNPIVVFHKVISCAGSPSPFPLITNLFASRARCARALGSTPARVSLDYYQLTRRDRVSPQVVSKSEAPVKEEIKVGDRVDLTQLPAPLHHYMDPGPYFTAGLFITYDPDTGVDNCALQRGWIVDRSTIRTYPYRISHNWMNLRKNMERGQATKVAYAVGHHPAVILGGQVKLGYPESHFAAIGGLLGEPLRLAPSETLGSDFLVPADAEVVVEGIMSSYELYPEGPFGEYAGYTGPQVPNPQFQVTAITHRKGAYWHDIMAGHPDHQVMGGFSLEAAIYETVKQRVPSLVNVYMPVSGACRFHVYLQLENPTRGDAREAIMAALTVNYVVKHAFVFDTDIDILDEREALFAIATRSQWDRDVMIFPNVKASLVDPSAINDLGSKGGIDCTKPPGEDFSERNAVEPSILEEINLSDFVPREKLSQIPKGEA